MPAALQTPPRTPPRTPPAAPAGAPAAALPWWRFGIVWLTFGLPASVVVAGIATGVIAWRHADLVVSDRSPATAASASAPAAIDSLAPAVAARNHAATTGR